MTASPPAGTGTLVPVGAAHAMPAFSHREIGAGGNAGSIAIEESRAIAEAQGQLILAKRFPRSLAASHAEFMDACKSDEFAKTAFYSVPNRGSGPSIRFAEEVARCYGNFQYGHRELSRGDGKSEVEVYAWDMERNNYSKRQITVLHVLDTKNGPKKLVDQADIDNKIANVASKQIRGRILALVPKHIVAAGVEQCKQTLAGGADKPVSQRIASMTAAFSKYGITTAHLEARLGHKLDNTTIDELADLMGVYTAIREGASPKDYFDAGKSEEGNVNSTAAAITAAAQGPKATAKPEPKKAEPKPKAEPVTDPEPVTEQKEEEDIF